MFQNLQLKNGLPTVEELKFIKIHRNYLKVLLLNFVIISIVMFTLFYFFIVRGPQTIISEYRILLSVGVGFTWLLFLTLTIVGFYRRKYAVREKDISYKSGVLFQSLTVVPYARVQHVEIDEKPFSRMFKLASLSIYTAGESGGDLEINGLPKEEAQKIKEFIINFINE